MLSTVAISQLSCRDCSKVTKVLDFRLPWATTHSTTSRCKELGVMRVSAANPCTLGELEISAAFSPCISVRSEGTAAAWEPLPLTQPVSAQSSEILL